MAQMPRTITSYEVGKPNGSVQSLGLRINGHLDIDNPKTSVGEVPKQGRLVVEKSN